MKLTGMHITAAKRLPLSRNGNPRFNVAMVDQFGEGHIYETQSDAACSYDVENLVTEHRKDPDAVVTVELTKAGRISTLTRCPYCGPDRYGKHGIGHGYEGWTDPGWTDPEL